MASGPAAEDDWAAIWEPMIAKVGTDVGGGELIRGADPIERSAIRRYLEPLEFDCALHYDPEVARAHGYDDVIAPYSSVITFTTPPMWEPGQHLFTSDDRNAQPASSPINGERTRVDPKITGFFATDMEFEFMRPPVVGERLVRRGSVLKSCVPKWTSVGRGAFLTSEAEILSEETGEVIARSRNTVFAYEPVGPPPSSAPGEDAA